MNFRKRNRKRRAAWRPPELTSKQILAWADDWFQHNGKWPRMTSGRIPGAFGDNWHRVDAALREGLRGLPGGSSLAQLLARMRGSEPQ